MTCPFFVCLSGSLFLWWIGLSPCFSHPVLGSELFTLCEHKVVVVDTDREVYIEGFLSTLCLQQSPYELPRVTTAACTHQLWLLLHPFWPFCVYVWGIKRVSPKLPPLQFHYISLSSPGQGDKDAVVVYLLTDQSLSSGRTPYVNLVRLHGSPSSLNK